MALQEILDKLEHVTETLGDAEEWHWVADKLLVDALQLLATDENREIANKVIEAYRAVPKWYR